MPKAAPICRANLQLARTDESAKELKPFEKLEVQIAEMSAKLEFLSPGSKSLLHAQLPRVSCPFEK